MMKHLLWFVARLYAKNLVSVKFVYWFADFYEKTLRE